MLGISQGVLQRVKHDKWKFRALLWFWEFLTSHIFTVFLLSALSASGRKRACVSPVVSTGMTSKAPLQFATHTHQPHKINKTKICFHQAFCNFDHKRFGSPRVQSLCHLAGVPSFPLQVTNASPHLTHNSPTHFQSLPSQSSWFWCRSFPQQGQVLLFQGCLWFFAAKKSVFELLHYNTRVRKQVREKEADAKREVSKESVCQWSLHIWEVAGEGGGRDEVQQNNKEVSEKFSSWWGLKTRSEKSGTSMRSLGLGESGPTLRWNEDLGR